MKKFKIAVLFTLFAALFGTTAFGAAYADVAGHPDESYITEYSEKGLVTGYPDGTFRPDATITRAEVAALLKNLNLPPVSEKNTEFSDVFSSDWYYSPVNGAVKSGLVSGYEENVFKPQNNMTRYEAISIVSRMIKSEGYNNVQLPYTDSENIPAWVNGAVRNLYAGGIISNYAGNEINGNAYITRAEIVKMLDKVMRSYGFDTAKVVETLTDKASSQIAEAGDFPHDVLGYLTIESIGIKEFPVKDGADLTTIKSAVGHFSETPLWDGNVGFCAHNRDYKYDFRNLKNVEQGDKAMYKTRFGERTYTISVIKTIEETDWKDILETGDVNKLTMVTCIESQPTKRLLVQAVQE